MMKTKSLLLPFILCSFIVIGCGISDDEDPGRRPRVTGAFFYTDTSPGSTSNVTVDDEITIEVHLEDPDFDIVALYVTIYDFNNTNEVYDGPDVYELDPVDVYSFSVSKQLDVAFSTGEYRVDFQAVDKKGHASLIFRKKINVQ